jgi:presenilin-like A22 family membrane protease
MKQSRFMSAGEAVTNVLVGYLVAVATNWLVLPLFGFAVSMGDSAAIGLVFTFVAVIRGYALRRLFEAIRVRSRETGSS